MLTKKQKILHAVIFVLVIVLFMGSVNYYVDSYAQIRISYLDIAKQMAEGQNVTGLTESRYNERYLALATIQTMEEPAQCIVLGSSRSMIYGREHFNVDSFYNFSLSGGTLMDYYGILGYLADAERLPQTVIMEIGGPLFYEEDTEKRYTYLQGGIDYLNARMDGENAACDTPDVGKQYQKLLSIDYFKYNLQCLQEKSRFAVHYTEKAEHESSNTKLADGSIAYSTKSNERTVEYVNAMTQQAISTKSLYKIEGYTEMSDALVTSFEKLVTWLTAQGVEVVLFLPPYSETIYAYMKDSGDYNGVFSTEDYIVEFAKENDLELYGSYSSEGCNLKPEDLLDAYHMRRECGLKAFYLREQRGKARVYTLP